MKESAVWEALKRETSDFLHIKRVENRLEPGFPDTIWVSTAGKTGLWELKDWEGMDWVSKDQALWLRQWAERGGICGVLAKKTRGEWLYWPAFPTFEWMRSIQNKLGLAPGFVMTHISSSFVFSLSPTSIRVPEGIGSTCDPRQRQGM